MSMQNMGNHKLSKIRLF